MTGRVGIGGLCAALLAVLLACPAEGNDHVVAGAQLATFDRPYPGHGGLTLVLRDPSIPVPVAGSPDDPSLAGLTVTIFGHGSGQSRAISTIPGPDLWTVRSTPHATAYGYRDKSATGSFGADVLTAHLRTGGALRIRIDDAPISLDLAEGAIAVRVAWGAVRVCTIFDGDAVRRNEPYRFVARKADVPAIADCEDATLAGP